MTPRPYPSVAKIWAGHAAVWLLEKIGRWDDADKNLQGPCALVIKIAVSIYSRLRRPEWSKRRAPWNRTGLSGEGPRAYYAARTVLALDYLRTLRKSKKVRMLGEAWPPLPWGSAPVLLLGIHHGNFEAILRCLAESPPLPLWRGGLFAPTFSETLFDWMGRQRESMGLRVLAAGDAASLRIWIREAGILGTMADQGKEPFRWEVAPGVTAPWPESLLRFARNQGVWVLAAAAVADRPGLTRIRFGPAWDLKKTGEADFKKEFSKWSSGIIAANPLLYDWSYPRLRMETGVGPDS